ncbi:MAG: methylated-DNA--[protein]-cysteine S-methyltransferase [Sulfurospirillum sp.]|nr:methylated-DNA--[protein]-cysteine S-methyltransferase [Sulfurospirillum sp.]MBP9612527.1 methylated-DNA--[protein]-cysteine S-methyltransferase [Sulfurospirillum sp.]
MAKCVFETPLGKIIAVADEEGLCSLDFDENASASDEENVHLTQLQRELTEYFEGKRKTFDVRLNPKGTPFQRAVWRTLCDIPYGSVISYSQEAQMLSHAKAVRAVANANGKNPIPIIIPCHRVIAKGGGIGGYSGGIWRKEFMLELERKNG